MFNAEIKNRYISEKVAYTSMNEFFYPSLFERSRPFEEELNKDICNFTTSEAENMLRTNDYVSIESIIVAVSGYKTYCDWCVTQGLVNDSQNHFAEFSRERLSGMINRIKRDSMIISRETLLEWCNQLPNPRDQFLLIGLFEGISGKNFCELLNIRESDIDIENNTINIKDRGVLNFSYELCKTAIDSINTTNYFSMTNGMLKTVKFIDSDYVIKEYPNVYSTSEFQKGRRIYMAIKRAVSFLGAEYMYPNNFKDSGVIHMIKTKSNEFGMTQNEYIKTHIHDIQKQYNMKSLRPAVIEMKYGNYLD